MEMKDTTERLFASGDHISDLRNSIGVALIVGLTMLGGPLLLADPLFQKEMFKLVMLAVGLPAAWCLGALVVNHKLIYKWCRKKFQQWWV